MRLALDRIHVGKRVRPINEAIAALYAEAIRQKGDVDQPLLVRPMEKHIGHADHELVAGGHRYAGAKLAGLKDIEARVKAMTPQEAWLAQIDENLIRADLTALDRAVHLAERKKIWNELHPERRGGDRRPTKRSREEKQKSQDETFVFSDAAADAIGMSKATVFRAVQLAEALGPDLIDKLRGTPIADNASELKALAKLEPAKRERVVKQLATGKTPTFSTALKAAGLGAPELAQDEVVFRGLVTLWSRASKKTKSRFMAQAGLTNAK